MAASQSSKRQLKPFTTPATIAYKARREFLIALADIVPSCLDAGNIPSNAERIPLLTRSAIVATLTGDETGVISHICQWQSAWNLHDDWMFQVARNTLSRCASEPPSDQLAFVLGEEPNLYEGRPQLALVGEDGHQLGQLRGHILTTSDLAEWVELEVNGRTEKGVNEFIGYYDPRSENWAAARERLTKELLKRLEAWAEGKQLEDERLGAVRTQQKREPDSEALYHRHYKWIVMFQVLGEDKYDIAAQCEIRPGKKPSSDAVRDGIKGTAERIGLSLRGNP